MYAGIVGVSMNNHLGPILSIFLKGFYENIFVWKCRKPYVYLRYVDYTFSSFDSNNDTMAFHSQLNSRDPS